MTTKMHTLSKSTFVRGCQCEKSLYLNKYHKEFQSSISTNQEAVFWQGKEVGILARQLFPKLLTEDERFAAEVRQEVVWDCCVCNINNDSSGLLSFSFDLLQPINVTQKNIIVAKVFIIFIYLFV